ncbi:MAG: hypothetical protein PHE84_05855 [bacterium]|nr:hypothetical protein [bacterium]
MMELQIQFGYGMMDHSRYFVETWGGGTVILSPRDLTPDQLERLSREITTSVNGKVLLDPQFYLPNADHERLTSHTFWPSRYSTKDFWSGPKVRELIRKLLDLNIKLGSEAIILPGLFAEKIDEDWLARQILLINEAHGLTTLPLFITVALGERAVRSDTEVEDILAAAEDWDAGGIYLVCEHPGDDYLVKDPTWLANVLDLVAGLRLKNKKVLVGYCNHQMLALACVGANWIASGTWMNVRSFSPDKFRNDYDEEIKQRATWYYCPQVLSEYKIPFLDIAKKQGILARMTPPKSLGSQHADLIFSGVQPSVVGWTEQSAFRHYLQCLWSQVRTAHRDTFDETADFYERGLDSAEILLTELHRSGVRGQMRDFLEVIDVNRAALSVIRTNRGPMLRRKWSSL